MPLSFPHALMRAIVVFLPIGRSDIDGCNISCSSVPYQNEVSVGALKNKNRNGLVHIAREDGYL